jgi:hypothetical protein
MVRIYRTQIYVNVRYKFKNGVENGIKFNVPLFEEWKEVNGSGILFNIGLGYRF